MANPDTVPSEYLRKHAWFTFHQDRPALALLMGTPFFIVFGALSDRIGRLKIIPRRVRAWRRSPTSRSSTGLAHFVNPALEQYPQASTPITVAATDCEFHIFVFPRAPSSPICDKAKDFLTKQGVSFTSKPGDGRDHQRSATSF